MDAVIEKCLGFRERRRGLGLSQGEIAERSGLSRTHYSRIENGHAIGVRAQTIAAIEGALHEAAAAAAAVENLDPVHAVKNARWETRA